MTSQIFRISYSSNYAVTRPIAQRSVAYRAVMKFELFVLYQFNLVPFDP
jgi:hypothetical protein